MGSSFFSYQVGIKLGIQNHVILLVLILTVNVLVSWHLKVRCFGLLLLGGDPGRDPEYAGEIIIFGWLGLPVAPE